MSMMPRKDVSFHKPAGKADIERRRKMADMIMAQGQQPQGTEVISGVAVKQSPLAGLAKALTQGVGGYQAGQAARMEQEREDAKRKAMADALGAYSSAGDPTQGALAMQQILMGNEETAPLALGQAMDNAQYDLRFPKELELARQKAQIEAQYGGDSRPATVQQAYMLANARGRAQPNEQDMLDAWKVVKYEPGMTPVPPPPSPLTPNVPPPPAAQQFGPANGEFGNIPPITQSQLDGNPAQGLPPAPFPPRPQMSPSQQSGVGVMPGYLDAKASMADVESRTKTQAQKDVELTMNPQIEEATKRAGVVGAEMGETQFNYTQLKAAYPQLIKSTDRLSQLAKVATYTNAGKGRDWIKRELGIDVGEPAEALAEMENIISVEVLPQLKPTFGAAFTVNEGKWLKDTMSDTRLSPSEKMAQISARVRGWDNNLTTMENVLSIPEDQRVEKMGGNPKQYQDQDQEGDTATGPNGKMIFRGGRWIPL